MEYPIAERGAYPPVQPHSRPKVTYSSVGPHANDFYGPLGVEHLIDEAVLNVDAPGECAGEIANQLLEGRRALIEVAAKNREQSLRLVAQPAALRFFERLSGPVS